jgi:membrane-bound serine protease (ClpP class)
MELVAALLIAGVVLLLLETILPGAVAGIVGSICLVAGIIVSYQKFDLQTANLVLTGVILVLVGGGVLWVKFFPESALARPFISHRTIGNVDAQKPELLDQTGTAHTNLRPSGIAIINGKRVDVVTEGGMIERGTAVKVVQIEGMRVVVRALESSGQTQSSKVESKL